MITNGGVPCANADVATGYRNIDSEERRLSGCSWQGTDAYDRARSAREIVKAPVC